jgi:hypothetical protein
LLTGIKRFYTGHDFHGSVFVSLILSASISMAIYALSGAFSYADKSLHVPIPVYLSILATIFAASLCALSFSKLDAHITRNEGLLLVSGIIISLIMALVVL